MVMTMACLWAACMTLKRGCVKSKRSFTLDPFNITRLCITNHCFLTIMWSLTLNNLPYISFLILTKSAGLTGSFLAW